ncbi:hypothetical protein DQ04_00011140 [Trypanosoma grayi]|uniref:hypothetical protein n=1 Tax=Trypanosoma grayi TaxID=71804 RepID=UPI0004F4909E|nr:hypothetical protein DQ04_00011140 [Trypanosoma grayi]KEG15647.1 hypothetical protein DQ04_00011140 [Trypanosoma grayi]
MGNCCRSNKDSAENRPVPQKHHESGESYQVPSREQLTQTSSLPLSVSSGTPPHLVAGAHSGDQGRWMMIQLPAEKSISNTEIGKVPSAEAKEEREEDRISTPAPREHGNQEELSSHSKEKPADADLFSNPDGGSNYGTGDVQYSTSPEVIGSTQKKEVDGKVGPVVIRGESHRSSSNSIWSATEDQQHETSTGRGEAAVHYATPAFAAVHTLPKKNDSDDDSENRVDKDVSHVEDDRVGAADDHKTKNEEGDVVVAAHVSPVAMDAEALRESSEGPPHSKASQEKEQDQQHHEGQTEVRKDSDSDDEEAQHLQGEAKAEDSAKKSRDISTLASIIHRNLDKELQHGDTPPAVGANPPVGLQTRENVVEFDVVFTDNDEDGEEDDDDDRCKSTEILAPVFTAEGGAGRKTPQEALVRVASWRSEDVVDRVSGHDAAKGPVVEGDAKHVECIDSGSSDGGSERRRLTSIVQRPKPPLEKETNVADTVMRKNDEVMMGTTKVEGEEHSESENGRASTTASNSSHKKSNGKGSPVEQKSAVESGDALSPRPRPVPIISPPPVTPQSKDTDDEDVGDLL